MEYYCEVYPYQENPYFSDYKVEANSDEDAMKFFKDRHGNSLVFVYDENFREIFNKENQMNLG